MYGTAPTLAIFSMFSLPRYALSALISFIRKNLLVFSVKGIRYLASASVPTVISVLVIMLVLTPTCAWYFFQCLSLTVFSSLASLHLSNLLVENHVLSVANCSSICTSGRAVILTKLSIKGVACALLKKLSIELKCGTFCIIFLSLAIFMSFIVLLALCLVYV